MRLPEAYRCLARPSSATEPSHPPGGVVTAVAVGFNIRPGLRMICQSLTRYASL